MRILIVYKSKTGFTKKYTEIVSKAVPSTLMSYKEVNERIMSQYDIVVYGSRMHAGFVDGLKKAREQFVKSGAGKFVVFATGGTPNTAVEQIAETWKNNLTAEELDNKAYFYMQAGICYEKMNFADKSLMKMAAKMMNNKKDKSEVEEGFAHAITSSYDISAEEFAAPLIEYLLKIQ